MGLWSTVSISMNLFTAAFEQYRQLATPDLLEAAMPYPLTRVEDVVSRLQMGGPLPKGFYERRYYIMKGTTSAAVLDTAFHEDEGLVNFSFVLRPTEFFKKRAAEKVFADHVIPYAAKHTGLTEWQELAAGQFFLVDEARSLVLQAKFYFVRPMQHFGLAVIERRYSGLNGAVSPLLKRGGQGGKRTSTLPDELIRLQAILDEYVAIHDLIFKRSLRKIVPIAGFFKAIDFRKHTVQLDVLLRMLEELASSSARQDLPKSSGEYFSALQGTIVALRDICAKLHGKSIRGGKSYSWRQYKADVAAYQELVGQYRTLGLALNRQL